MGILPNRIIRFTLHTYLGHPSAGKLQHIKVCAQMPGQFMVSGAVGQENVGQLQQNVCLWAKWIHTHVKGTNLISSSGWGGGGGGGGGLFCMNVYYLSQYFSGALLSPPPLPHLLANFTPPPPPPPPPHTHTHMHKQTKQKNMKLLGTKHIVWG